MRVLQTQAISSDLSGTAAMQVRAVWARWQERFGIAGAASALHPHLTWVVGEVEEGALVRPLDALARASSPLEIVFSGIGAFNREIPVVYLRVELGPALREMHDRMTGLATSAGMKTWRYYQGEMWIPHVTLALRDIDSSAFRRLVDDASSLAWTRSTMLDRVSLVHLGPVIEHCRTHDYLHTWTLGG